MVPGSEALKKELVSNKYLALFLTKEEGRMFYKSRMALVCVSQRYYHYHGTRGGEYLRYCSERYRRYRGSQSQYLYLYLRYYSGQPVSYRYLQILGQAKDKILLQKSISIAFPVVYALFWN